MEVEDAVNLSCDNNNRRSELPADAQYVVPVLWGVNMRDLC